jgi:thymidylate synthase (FAD)
MEIKLLNDGFIRLVDTMGDDTSIVQAARVSYGKGTKSVSDDTSLIRYLLRHGHTSPFEMCEIKLHVRVPMDTWSQWIRHRMASVNEYSTRYSEAIDSFYVADKWRLQSDNNKQGSDGILEHEDMSRSLSLKEYDLHQKAKIFYQEQLDNGIARELARKDLPLSTYTEAYWKIDLHNLLHFLRLRMDKHAQWEIRQYANAIAEIVEKWVPITWQAFLDYKVNSMTLSALEIDYIKNGILAESKLSKREILELNEKMQRLGIVKKEGLNEES